MNKKTYIIIIGFLLFFCFINFVNADTIYANVLDCSSSSKNFIMFEYNGAQVCTIEEDINFVGPIDLIVTCPDGFSTYEVELAPHNYIPAIDDMPALNEKIRIGYGCYKMASGSNNIINYENLCTSNEDVQKAMKIISTVLLIAHWLVPFIIIVLGMIDFVRAAISDDEKATSKAGAALIRRIVAGIVIFLIPTIMIGILNMLDLVLPSSGDNIINSPNFRQCTKCLFNIKEC